MNPIRFDEPVIKVVNKDGYQWLYFDGKQLPRLVWTRVYNGSDNEPSYVIAKFYVNIEDKEPEPDTNKKVVVAADETNLFKDGDDFKLEKPEPKHFLPWFVYGGFQQVEREIKENKGEGGSNL